MKKTILISAVVLFTAIAFSACGNKAAKTEDAAEEVVANTKAFICPMHPEIGSDTMTVCSECGMDLVANPALTMDSLQMDIPMDSVM